MPVRPRAADELIYTRKTDYYRQTTHEFNLPAGWSCPWAQSCLTKADRDTGKLVERPDRHDDGTPKHIDSEVEAYVCYAARAERYPSVRQTRWHNYNAVRERLSAGDIFDVPRNAAFVRVHGSGDFFNEQYFLMWMRIAAAHPDVKFWAFTKSIKYWTDNLDAVPENFALTASRGSKQDDLIDRYGLRTAQVFYDLADVPDDMVVDRDDWEAQHADAPAFALLENMANRRQASREDIDAHNVAAYLAQGRDATHANG